LRFRVNDTVLGPRRIKSVQSEERQDRENDHDKPDQIDDTVHSTLLTPQAQPKTL